MSPPVPKPRLWPRDAIGPLGNRATFHCVGDVPHGWVLEHPLPGEPEPDAGNLATLREEYQAAFGKKPGPKWDAATIRAKLAGAA